MEESEFFSFGAVGVADGGWRHRGRARLLRSSIVAPRVLRRVASTRGQTANVDDVSTNVGRLKECSKQ